MPKMLKLSLCNALFFQKVAFQLVYIQFFSKDSLMQIRNKIYNKNQSVNINKIMDSAYTPQKDNKTINRNTATQSYIRKTPDLTNKTAPASQLALLKDYESLKIQVRQLEAKNRTLISEVDQLQYEKSYSESKFVQKMSFQEETLTQFHKEKNYQIQLLQIKHEQDMSRIKREHQLRIDEFLRDIKHKDYQLKEKDEQIRYLEARSEQLKKDYELLDCQLMKSREQIACKNQSLTHVQFKNKKLEMLIDELECHRAQMQQQIRVLLDIEAQKSRDINSLQIRLRNSEENQRRLTQKLNILNENFVELQQHISVMKSKLIAADQQNHSLAKELDHANIQIKQKEGQILDQNGREGQLRLELEDHQKRETRREREVTELIDENERLYKQLNMSRHRLHEMGITYGFDV